MKKILILVIALATFGCVSMKIGYDYDKEADFAKYKTYQFSQESSALGLNQLNQNRVIKAVEAQMAAKGFTKAENPDLVVDINIAGREVQTATATTSGGYGGYGYGRYRGYGYGGGFSTTHINYDTYTEGTMVITLVDALAKQIIWQGRGTKTIIENMSPEQREKSINHAVESIFKNYPPKTK